LRPQEQTDVTDSAARTAPLARADRDIVTFGIAITAIIMFVGTGGSVLPQVVRSIWSNGAAPDLLLVNAVLLNIALVIFGWRRYRELTVEVGERRKAESHARELAELDPLTGCLNRRSIGPATDALLAANAERGLATAFLMIDLDNFKQVNDINGHAAGDAILRQSAKRITAALPAGSLVARFGGDEFACALTFDPHHADRVDGLAADVIAAVSQPVDTDAGSVETTISVGIASNLGSGSARDGASMLHLADIAMYHAKKHGRNRAAWFEPAMENELKVRSELAAGIRAGVPLGEFVPYYEKQIDLASGDLVGFEMLARWKSPTLGLVGPEVFIPVAEEIGMIAALSESVIAQALRDARHWNPRLSLSVNISPIQLRDPWFAQKLLRLLVEANFPPSRLVIEVTESCLHEDLGLVRSLISSLKNQGIKISLDDFGTGYSSLAQLQSLPFDSIKIDRSFISNLGTSPESTTIVEAITSLGRGLGLPITAEGIECPEILARLQELGQFNGQGYFYGKPQPAGVTNHDLAQLDLLLEAKPEPAAPQEAQPHVRRA
jgi:diguanylate cyclase (GGDEF)-like protein